MGLTRMMVLLSLRCAFVENKFISKLCCSSSPPSDGRWIEPRRSSGAMESRKTAANRVRKSLGLNALATHPSYQRNGAATMLVQWGMQQADREGLECFSACTGTAKSKVGGILERCGWLLEGREVVIQDMGLSTGDEELGCVFGGRRAGQV